MTALCLKTCFLALLSLALVSEADLEVRLVIAVTDGTEREVYNCDWGARACEHLASPTVGGSRPYGHIAMDIEAGLPRGFVINGDASYAEYCTMAGSCAKVASCADDDDYVRFVDFDKGSDNTILGYYLSCHQSGSVTYCSTSSASCSTILSTTSDQSLQTASVEPAADGTTAALLIAFASQVKRCPVGENSWTIDSANCVSIGGTFSFLANVDYLLDAEGNVESYLVRDSNHDAYKTSRLLKCWLTNRVCEELYSTRDFFPGPTVVRNPDGTTYGYALPLRYSGPRLVLTDLTSTQISGYSSCASAVGFVVTTTTTTTTTTTFLEVDWQVHVVIAVTDGTDREVYDCDWGAYACEHLASPTVGGFRAYGHIAMDMEAGAPRGFVINGDASYAEYCTMAGSCAKVGSCADGDDYVRFVDFDKGSDNTIIGYYLSCQESGSVTYCSTSSGSCSTILSTTSDQSLQTASVEPAADGTTAALLIAFAAQVKRCPIGENSWTINAANCVSIGGFFSFLANVDYLLDAEGNVESYLVRDSNHDAYKTSRLLRCWLTNQVCEELYSTRDFFPGPTVVRFPNGTTYGYALPLRYSGPRLLLAGDLTSTQMPGYSSCASAVGYLVTTTTTTTMTTNTMTTTTPTTTVTTITATATTATATTTTTQTATTTTTTLAKVCPGLPDLDTDFFDATSIELCANLVEGKSCLVACAGADSSCSDSAACISVTCTTNLSFNLTATRGACQPSIVTDCFTPYLDELSVSFTSSVDTSTVVCTGASDGSTCSLGCDTDYYIANSLQGLVCDADGSFQGSLQEACVPKACSLPPSLYSLSQSFAKTYSLSESDCAGKLHEELCQIECTNGQTNSAGYLKCLGSTWSMLLEPECGEVTCSLDELPVIDNGAVVCSEEDGPFVEGSVCAITCEEGYSLSGELACTSGAWGMTDGLGCRVPSSTGTNKTTALLGSLQIFALSSSSTTSGEDSATETIDSTLATLETANTSVSSAELAAVLRESLTTSNLTSLELALTVFESRGTLAMLETSVVVGAEASTTVAEQREVAAALCERALLAGLDAGDVASSIMSAIVTSSVSAVAQANLLQGLGLSLRLDRMLYLLQSEATRRLTVSMPLCLPTCFLPGVQTVYEEAWPLYEAMWQWDSEAILRPAPWQSPTSERVPRWQAMAAIARSAGIGIRYGGGSALQALVVGPYLAAAALETSDGAEFPSSDDLQTALAGLGTVVTMGGDSSFWRLDSLEDRATQIARIAALLASEGWVAKTEDAATILPRATAMLMEASLSRAEAVAVAAVLAIERTNDDGDRICTTRPCFCEVGRLAGELLKMQGSSYLEAANAMLTSVLGVSGVASDVRSLWAFSAALASVASFSTHAINSVSSTLLEVLGLESDDDDTTEAQALASSDSAAGDQFLKLGATLASSPGNYRLSSRDSETLTASETAIALRRVLPLDNSVDSARILGRSLYGEQLYAPIGLLSLGYSTEEDLILADRANFFRDDSSCAEAVFAGLLASIDPSSTTTASITSSDLDIPNILGVLTSACLDVEGANLASNAFALLGDYWTGTDANAILEALSLGSGTLSQSYFDEEDALGTIAIEQLLDIHVGVDLLATSFWALHHTSGTGVLAPLARVAAAHLGTSEDAGGSLVESLLTTAGPYFAVVDEAASVLVAALSDFRLPQPFGNPLFSAAFKTARGAAFVKAKPWSHEILAMSLSASVSSNPMARGRPLLGSSETVGKLWRTLHEEVSVGGAVLDVAARATQSIDSLLSSSTGEANHSTMTAVFSDLASEIGSALPFAAACYDALLAVSERYFTFEETITLLTETAVAVGYAPRQIPPAVGLIVLLRDGTYAAGVDRLRAVRTAMTLAVELINVDDSSRELNCSATSELTHVCSASVLPALITAKTSMYMGIQDVVELTMGIQEAEALAYLVSSQLPFVPPLGILASLTDRLQAASSGVSSLGSLIQAESEEQKTRLSAAQAQGSAWFALRSQSYEEQFAFNSTVSVGKRWGLSSVDSVLSAGTLALTQAVESTDVLAWSAAWLQDQVKISAWSQDALGALLAKTVEFEATTNVSKARASLASDVRGGAVTGWQALRYSVLRPTTVQAAVANNSYAYVSVAQLLTVFLEAGYTPAEASAMVTGIDSSDSDRAMALAKALLAQGFDLQGLVPTLLEGFSESIRSTTLASLESLDEASILFPSLPVASAPSERRLRALQEDAANTSTAVDSGTLSAEWAIEYQEHLITGLANALSVTTNRIYITSTSSLASSSSSTRRLAAKRGAKAKRSKRRRRRRRMLQARSASRGLRRGLPRRLATTEAQGFTVAFAVTDVDVDDATSFATLQGALASLGDGGGEEVGTFVSTLTSSLVSAGVTIPTALTGTVLTSSTSSGVSTDFVIPFSAWTYEDFPACSCGDTYTVTRDIVCSSGIEAACDANYYAATGESRPSTSQVCNATCTLTCPYGEDFFIGCDLQVASTVLVSVGACLLVCGCFCCACSFMCRTPTKGKVKVNLDKIGSTAVIDAKGKKTKFTISTWHRGTKETDDGKERIVWENDLAKVAVAMGVSMAELEADLELQKIAINTDTEVLGGQVSLGFLSEDWTLSAKVKTKTKRAGDFLCGKVFLEGDVPDVDGEIEGTAKALLLMQGHVVFETAAGFLTSTSTVNDGKDHRVTISYKSAEKLLTMQINGKEEAQLSVEYGLSGDHKDAFWLAASCVDKPSLEDTPERRYPLNTLVGKLSDLTYNGRLVVNPVHGGNLPPKGYTLTCKEGELAEAQRSERRHRTHSDSHSSVRSEMPGAFPVQAKVEYFSVTHGQWVSGLVEHYLYVKKGDNSVDLLHNLRLKSGTDRRGVSLPLLRSALRPGEPCSIYSISRGEWVPALAARTQLNDPSMWGYRVYYESELAQHRAVVAPEQRLLGQHLCPVRKANSIVVRKRFEVGSRVQVWKDTINSWVYATVLALAPVDGSEFVNEGELFHEGGWRRKQELPDLPIAHVPYPWRAPNSTRQNSRHSSSSASTTTPALPIFDRTSLSAPSAGRDSPMQPPSDAAAYREMSLHHEKLALALWELATVVEEVVDDDGDTGELIYDVETYRMRMRPEDWGKEERLPPLKEELVMVLRNGGIKVPLTSTLQEVMTQFKEDVVDGAQAVAEQGRKQTRKMTATITARAAHFAEGTWESEDTSENDVEQQEPPGVSGVPGSEAPQAPIFSLDDLVREGEEASSGLGLEEMAELTGIRIEDIDLEYSENDCIRI